MASFGRLSNALLNLKPELSLGLAHINFDFSLMKVEAPASYLGVGQAISNRRKNGAEDGSMHVTARRLGALFRNHIPDTPLLIDAYGKRATEIAEKDQESGKPESSVGLFTDFFGPDATSIWAAATSGSNAIAVHLLACILARVWSPAEAVSIWVELVQAQREEIMEQFSRGGQDFDRYLAALPEIDRTALADWDNSARAWIRRADQVMKDKQRHVEVTLSNIDLAVGVSQDTLTSVLDGWKSALHGMESLLRNQSQIVNDGSLALALSCWHLYPNLDVPDGEVVVQHDPLFAPEAEAILGLQVSPGQQPRGVYWSLSLSKLRFYGAPERTTQSFNIDTTRLTLEQFRFVALGCLAHTWIADMTTIDTSCKAVSQLYDSAFKEKEVSLVLPWMSVLGNAAEEFLNARNPRDRSYLMKLINLGRGRGKALFGEPTEHPSYLFGLTEPDSFLASIKKRRDQISLLRRIAKRRFASASPGDILIQCFDRESSTEMATMAGDSGGSMWAKTRTHRDDHNSPVNSRIDITLTSESEGPETTAARTQPLLDEGKPASNLLSDALSTRKTLQYMTAIADSEGYHHRWIGDALVLKLAMNAPIEPGTKEQVHMIDQKTHSVLPDSLVVPLKQSLDHLSSEDSEQVAGEEEAEDQRGFEAAIRTLEQEKGYPRSSAPFDEFECFLGNPTEIAMFVRKSVLEVMREKQRRPYWVSKTISTQVITPDDVDLAFRQQIFNTQKLAEDLHQKVRTTNKNGSQYQFWRSLCALFWIDHTYRPFGDTTIDPAVVVRPLSSAKWFVDRRVIQRKDDLRPLSREEAFGCIGYLECGLDSDSSTFENVMAISSGDSIFVSTTLVCDPLPEPRTVAVKRILGNVGKPGIVLLVPPPSPMSLEPDPNSWQLVDNEPFNGQLEDRFNDTSLRMSFTGWTAPVHVSGAPTGRPFIEAHIIETLISVYSRSKWIADLDVLTAVNKASKFPDYPTFLRRGCDHDDKGEQGDVELTSINTWEGFLDNPPGPSVAMTYRNWLARLAMVALAVPRGDRVILSDGICWRCYQDLYELGGPELMRRALFIA